MGKFHVGDRWVDQDGHEWLLYQLDTDGEVRGVRVNDGVSNWFRDGRNKLYKLELTRLISSERWIPFAEMMPDEPSKDENRSLVIYRKAYDPQLLEAYGPTWADIDRRTLSTWVNTSKFTHWRYLQPPEASC